jgi:tRNA A37 threonylcarbamoyladenosine dehydratase
MATNPIFQRLELLVGNPALEALQRTRVILFGVGGVGSWAAEALIRSGIGHLTLVDSDRVCITNVNRQLQATTKSVGKPKAECLAERLLEINPRAEIVPIRGIYEPETAGAYDFDQFDFVLDAIDGLTGKIHLILETSLSRATLISSLGAALKLDPTQVRVVSIWKTDHDPLARVVRQRLRKEGFHGDFRCAFSPEVLPNQRHESVSCGTHACHCPTYSETPLDEHDWCSTKLQINGSSVFVTAAFGLAMASQVVQDVMSANPPENFAGVSAASTRTAVTAPETDRTSPSATP